MPKVEGLTDVGQPIPPGARRIFMVLRDVRIVGPTVYEAADLAKMYTNQIGKSVSLFSIHQLAQRITQRYVRDGYILATVRIQSHSTSTGVVRISVSEGRLAEIVFTNPADRRGDLLNRYAAKLKATYPVTSTALQRYVLLMVDLPGVVIPRIRFRMGRDPQVGHKLTIVNERRHISADLTIDNRISEPEGGLQFEPGMTVFSPFGHYHSTDLRSIFSRNLDLRHVELQHIVPVGAEGTKASLAGGHSTVFPGGNLESEDIGSRTYFVIASVEHPLVRSAASNLYLGGVASWVDASAKRQGLRIVRDRVGTLRVFVRHNSAIGRQTLFSAFGQISQGVPLHKQDTPRALRSREGGKSVFTKFEALSFVEHMLGGDWSLEGGAAAQVASTRLVSSEAFGIGGLTFGRAFDPSEVTGDHGIAVTLRLKKSIERPLGSLSKYPERIEFVGYFDWGRVWNTGERILLPPHETRASVGAGIVFQFTEKISAFVEVGKPVIGAVAGRGSRGRDARFFFGLTARY